MDNAHLMAVQHSLQDLLNAMTACKHQGRGLVPKPALAARTPATRRWGGGGGGPGRAPCSVPLRPALLRAAQSTTASGTSLGDIASGRPLPLGCNLVLFGWVFLFFSGF